MSAQPAVRHFIARKKEPIANGLEITLPDVFLYAIRPKPPFTYPCWQKAFFRFAVITNGMGPCSLRVQLFLVTLDADTSKEVEVLVGESKPGQVDLGNDRLKVWPISIMMAPVLLPQGGIYRLYLVCNGEAIAHEEIYAR